MRSLLGWESWREFDRYSRVMLAIPFGLALINLKNINLLTLFKFLIFIAAMSGFIFATYSRYGLNIRRIGMEMNSIQFAFMATILWVCTCIFSMHEGNWKMKCLWIFISFLILYAITLSGTQIAVPVIISMILYYFYNIYKYNSLSSFFICLSLLVVFLYFLIIFTDTLLESKLHQLYSLIAATFQKEELNWFGNLQVQDGSLTPRLILWQHGINIVDQNFWTGIGHTGLLESYKDKNIPGMKWLFASGAHLHNGFLHEWVVKGYIGLLFFISIILLPFSYFHREVKKSKSPDQMVLATCGIWAIIAFIIFNLTQVTFAHNSGVISYAMITSFLWASLSKTCLDFRK